MSKRYTELFIEQTRDRLSLGKALRDRLKEGYTRSDFLADLFSGPVVSLVAIPLAMALAIASGVAPQYGLFTIVVAGFFVAALGGSQFQVTGPTAAFVVVLAPIAQQFGIEGLLMAGFMAGALSDIGNHVRVIVFVLEDVPMMDVTGLVAFESAIARFLAKGKMIYLVALAAEPKKMLTEAGLIDGTKQVPVFDTFEDARRAV